MAFIVYRVSGLIPGEKRRIRREFPDTREGRVAMKRFLADLGDVRTRYLVRVHTGHRMTNQSFRRRQDADAYVAMTEADKLRGVVIDPRRARTTVREYADGWLTKRHDLADRTVELYRYLLDKHILPTFGDLAIGAVQPSDVRSWFAEVAAKHRTTAAKSYRLLREIFNTAVADEAIVRNPCQVKSAGQEKAPERPVATLAEVQALSDAMPESQRIAVLLAAWCQLRRGELLGLRRRDVDLLRGVLSIETTRTKTMAGTMVDKAPKTEAGRRTLNVPGHVMPALEDHLGRFVDPDPTAPVLAGGYRSLRTAWDNARARVGVNYRLHDLRHAGLTWSAATGATTAELMRRAGHASPAAALRYQHATEDRDKVLADALAKLATPADVVALEDARSGVRGLAPRANRAPKGS